MKIALARSPVTVAILLAIALVGIAEIADYENVLVRGAIIPGMLGDGEWWRIFTAMFLHAGWLHWFVNSWSLYQLGTLYEAMFGSRRFAIVYFGSGIVASLASSLHVQSASVGASGAIFGILGAFFFSIRRSPVWRNQPWTKSLLGQLIFFAALNIYIGWQLPFIDNTAHIAGLVSGLLLGFIPHRVAPPPPGQSVVDVVPGDESTLRQNQP